jgi:hypothetical protein
LSEQLKVFLWFILKTGLVIIAISTFELIVFFLIAGSYPLKTNSTAWNADGRFFVWGLKAQAAIILGLGLRRAIKNLTALLFRATQCRIDYSIALTSRPVPL